MAIIRLTHPGLDFWVDVRMRKWGGKWMAVADLADEPDIGTGEDARSALAEALSSLGEPYASEMAADADLSEAKG